MWRWRGRQRHGRWGRFGTWIGRTAACGALVVTGFSGCSRHQAHQVEWTADDMAAKLERGTSWLLWTVDANEEQRARVSAILTELKPDLVRFQDERRKFKDEWGRLLNEERIDPAQVESLRNTGRELAEQIVTRSIDTAMQAAQALTPEQRKRVVESWQRRL